ncbi:MAG: hypothetical protein CVT75_10040 [Alphaproteobacteria bacterium HGW-Alphaproteobacteria-14]|nr:MAG: hypothetical protein CVT75_10040 [Alphaproteobacteria bacterium HGW-Alphaproteobacteria-14]
MRFRPDPGGAYPKRNNHAPACAKDFRLDSNDSITIFFFTDSIWGLRAARLKLAPRVAWSRASARPAQSQFKG